MDEVLLKQIQSALCICVDAEVVQENELICCNRKYCRFKIIATVWNRIEIQTYPVPALQINLEGVRGALSKDPGCQIEIRRNVGALNTGQDILACGKKG